MVNSLFWDNLLWLLIIFLVFIFPYTYIRSKRSRNTKISQLKEESKSLGMDQPVAQFPQIDPSLCIGCGACITACPEGEVLGLVDGKVAIINGVKCVGHGLCAKACPINAITIGLGDVSKRSNIPNISDTNETTVENVYIAGELGGFALIKNAVEQGKKVVNHIFKKGLPSAEENVVDIAIIGCGPAGLSAALTAIDLGLRYIILDQQDMGGTVLQYPKRKLVLTDPVYLPRYGQLKKHEYFKEELLAIWESICKKENLNFVSRRKFEGLQTHHGILQLETLNMNTSEKVIYQAKSVILALGRRGTPRKLGASGEEKSKVMYSLSDASQFTNCRVLVVGGGDSAVEAAMALSEQKGTTVSLSYRKPKFFRIKNKNKERIHDYSKQKKVTVYFDSNLKHISNDSVSLDISGKEVTIENDYVFIFAGGLPPFPLLEKIGVKFN